MVQNGRKKLWFIPGKCTLMLIFSLNFLFDVTMVQGMAAPCNTPTNLTFSTTSLHCSTFSFSPSTSVTPTSYLWDFGDGVTSTELAPVHTYFSANTYTVTLSIFYSDGTSVCSDTYQDQVTACKFGISTNACASALFSFDLAGDPGNCQAYTFSPDASVTIQNPVSFVWDFGDGSPKSGNPMASHTYASPGRYNVGLSFYFWDSSQQALCLAFFSKQLVVCPSQIAGTCSQLNVSFTTESNDCQTLQFTSVANTSILTYHWDFGDGSVPSQDANPLHAYSNPGKYIVTLTVNAAGATCVYREAIFTCIRELMCDGSVDFNETAECLDVTFFPLLSIFGNITILDFNWDFGDGNTSITSDPNIQHVYSSPGTYTVSLTAHYQQADPFITATYDCNEYFEKDITITQIDPNLSASF